MLLETKGNSNQSIAMFKRPEILNHCWNWLAVLSLINQALIIFSNVQFRLFINLYYCLKFTTDIKPFHMISRAVIW